MRSHTGVDRRAFLAGCVATWGAQCWPGPSLGWVRPPLEDLAAMVAWLLAEGRDAAVVRAARALREAPCHERLVDAVGIAAALEIRPDIARFNHVALATHSVRSLLGSATPVARDVRVLWLVDLLKHDQADDAEADWRQEALPPTAGSRSVAAANEALVSALEQWQPDRAEQAVVDLHEATGDAARVFAALRPFGVRCQANLGHKAIYTAASMELLPRVPAPQQVAWLRSLVRSYFIHGRTERSATFERARQLAGQLPEPGVARDAEAGGELLSSLRGTDPAVALERAAALWREGVQPDVLWDAVLQVAAETALADGGVAALHAVTSAVAMAGLARAASGSEAMALPLLQAAAWQVWFRSTRRRGGSPEIVRVEAVHAERLGAMGEHALLPGLLDGAGEPGPGCLGRVLGLDAAARQRLVAEFASHVTAHAIDTHDLKLGAAVLEILPHVGDHTAAALLATGLHHSPIPGATPGNEVARLLRLREG